ncbi:sporulation integral membrane protein YtvI [Gorillibacterium massiliense]|uniref:sporulation integral membrane protein YtvI n=1 Tax=Gorillibacterium massiliense TaxID=1280390 RepID=UPI0004AE6330|nr:sporulation integral membrane protein YtvI [Gorillibacterium massiliense]
MLIFWKKYWRTIFDIAVIGVTVYLFMKLFSYIFNIATPIFLAFLIFFAIEPLAKRLHRIGVKKSLATAISTLIFVVILLGAIVGLGAIFTSQVTNIAKKIPDYTAMVQNIVEENSGYWQDKWALLPADITDRLSTFTTSITKFGGVAITWFFSHLMSWLSSFSSFLFSFLVGIILAYFLSIEIDAWKRGAREKTPHTFKVAFTFLKENVLAGLASYLKSQLKLVSITFIIIFVALLIMRVENAFTISLLSAIFDLLPLLGVPTLFIPWVIYLFIVGKTTLAISLTVLMLVVLLIRQIMEPKITGDSLGVSAFTMLSFMIISLSLFGVSGLIISPILIITLKALYNQGYLKKWIRVPEGEYMPDTAHPWAPSEDRDEDSVAK